MLSHIARGLLAVVLFSASSTFSFTASAETYLGELVTIRGYDGPSTEPFMTRDGKYILFNNGIDPPEAADLHVARRINDLTFDYIGPLAAANSDNLDGVPTVDETGNLYFVSSRSYGKTGSMIYHARFADGVASEATLLPDMGRGKRWVQFDVEISADGETMYLAEGRSNLFTRRIDNAQLYVAHKHGDTFVIDWDGDTFVNVSSKMMEYAVAFTRDQLTVWFTRTDLKVLPSIWAAHRDTTDEPFGPPTNMNLGGFVEAVTLSPDETLMYFHRLTPQGFRLFALPVED